VGSGSELISRLFKLLLDLPSSLRSGFNSTSKAVAGVSVHEYLCLCL
jgi:hypothetical protein